LRDEHELLETLYAIGTSLAGELDVDRLVQVVSDTLTTLVGAQFGAFFYNKVDETGESYTLYTLAGVPRSAFERFPLPRNTAVFAPTFRGDGMVRIYDVTTDPRFGHNEPYFGMPPGHLPVRSYLAAPVMSRTGDVLGGLFFGHARPGVFTERHERIVAAIAVQAGVAIDNAQQYEREHSLAVTLQRSFLPAALPKLPGMAVAAAYSPATHADVGGDWYDAVVLPDGRLSVAVGDVVGHDLQAAVTMGQLRNALRAFTFESQGPAEALRRLDRYCKLANSGQFATAIKVFYDPRTRHVLLARAGHLPALWIKASGEACLVEQIPAPPLGFGLLIDASIDQAEMVLGRGDTLVFYSDGLVERREESIDEGLQRLVTVASTAPSLAPEHLCGYLIASLLEPGRQMDDVAILALQAL
ncbi:MAG: hypothetical protein JWL70_2576, partial [Acidimicrobiia bacterium]|nr:hypothetical protein [Acidimicrobiia bacterium]